MTGYRPHVAGLWFGSVLLGLMVTLGGCQSVGSGPEITVLYPSASGLEVGDEVRMSDFAIGRIEEIELEPDGRVAVRIELQRKYGSHVTEGSTFRVKRDGIASADRYIEMKPGGGAPVADGTRFDGELSWDQRLRDLGQGLVDSAGDTDFRTQLEELAAAAERAARAGKEEWEARRPELEAQAQELLDKLAEQGGQAADRLREKIDEYLEQLEKPREPEDRGSQTI